MNKPIRHGEVILKPVKTIPKGKSETLNSFTVADSDAGHHHVLNSDQLRVVRVGDDVYLELATDGTIIHQKETDRHKDLPVVAGKYQVLKKTEYDPFEKVIRDVKD